MLTLILVTCAQAATGQNFENNFYQSVQKHCVEGKREKHWQLQSVIRLKRKRKKKLEWQLQSFFYVLRKRNNNSRQYIDTCCLGADLSNKCSQNSCSARSF